MKTKTQKPKTKTKKAKAAAPAVPDVATGDNEASANQIATDIAIGEQMANGVAPGDVVIPPELVDVDAPDIYIKDEFTTTVRTWNSGQLLDVINLRENSNVLNRFEYVPTRLTLGNGRKTKYEILTCSDTGSQVGKPFADTYGLLNNNAFLSIIEEICVALESLGLKFKISTTGTLHNRERSYISLQINHESMRVIDGREFQAFLNCLNSIPSNQGCTVTFANNSFCVCCRNTFAHVLTGKDGAKFHAAVKHTKGMMASLRDIPLLVESYFSGNEKLFANLKSFSVFPVSLTDAEGFFAAFIGRDLKGNLTDKTELKTRSANMIETLKNLFVTGKGNKGQTALDVFQAVTEYYTHFSAGKSEDTTKQIESSEAGSGYIAKNEFYQWLVTATQAKSNWQSVARVGDTLLMAYRKK